MRTAITCVLLAGAMCCPLVAASKVNNDQAKELVKEGKSLEDQGKLLEARAKYAGASQLGSREGYKDLAEVNKKIAAKTTELVTNAKTSFNSKDYPKATEQLLEARQYAPDSPDVNCDLGVTYHMAADDPKAIESLHSCVRDVAKPEEKERYEQLITQIETKDSSVTTDAVQKQALTSFNDSLRQNQETLPTVAEDADLCKNLLANQATLPKTPSVLFNLAKCSEDAGNLEDSSRYFSDYMKAAPDSTAFPEAKDVSQQLTSILAFDGPKRDDVRQHYRSASQYLLKGRYGLALKEYESVTTIAPDFAFGRRQLGLFYESLGRTEDAARELNTYVAMDGVAAEEKDWAAKEVATFPEKRTKYDSALRDASTKIRPLLFTGQAGADSATCDQIIQNLQTAIESFPLAPDANRLLGFMYIEANYPAGAKHSYDAAAAGDADPFFFAWVNGLKDVKGSAFSFIEVKKDGLQIEPLYSYGKRRARFGYAPSGGKKGGDANEPQSCHSVMENTDVLLPKTSCGEFLAVKDIRSVESKQIGIEVASANKPMWMTPVNLFEVDPMQSGPAARKFANRYTRVIQRYMENDVTKLGAEHMTGGEKFAMGMAFASAAMGGVGGAMGSINAATAAINVSMSAMQAMQIMQQYRAQNALLVKPGVYKPIPVDPAPLAFRVE
jgi:tetratricopeptide (TPR) repeat protein